MWIWTLDEQLLNLNQVETIEVVSVYEKLDLDDGLEHFSTTIHGKLHQTLGW